MSSRKPEKGNLPKGWTKEKLPQVAEVIMGQSPPSSTYNTNRDGLPFYQGKAEFGALYPSVIKYCNSPKKIAEEGDVLISVRAPVGPTNLCNETSCIGRGLSALRTNQVTTTKYLLYYMRDIEPWLSTQGTGSTFTAISKTDIENVEILLPPLNEQRRIVAKLEKLLQKVDACTERLDKIPTILKRFRQSILAAACSGRLTEDWREKNPDVESASMLLEKIQKERKKRYEEECKKAKLEGRRKPKKPKNIDEKLFAENVEEFELLPDKWVYIPLALVSDNKPDSIVDGPFGTSVNTKTDYIEKGIPVIRINNVKPFKFDPYGIKFMSETKFNELQRHKVLPGDVLLTKVGTIGDSCIFPSTTEKAILSTTGSCRISVDYSITNGQYVCIYLNYLKPYLNSIASEAVQAFLNMKTIKNIPFALPPIHEQQEIIRRVEALFKIADQIENRYTKARAYVDKLTQSILAKAFRGELVPQDPNDEPAPDLLQRIKQEKEKTETKPKSTKRGRKKQYSNIKRK